MNPRERDEQFCNARKNRVVMGEKIEKGGGSGADRKGGEVVRGENGVKRIVVDQKRKTEGNGTCRREGRQKIMSLSTQVRAEK